MKSEKPLDEITVYRYHTWYICPRIFYNHFNLWLVLKSHFPVHVFFINSGRSQSALVREPHIHTHFCEDKYTLCTQSEKPVFTWLRRTHSGLRNKMVVPPVHSLHVARWIILHVNLSSHSASSIDDPFCPIHLSIPSWPFQQRKKILHTTPGKYYKLPLLEKDNISIS